MHKLYHLLLHYSEVNYGTNFIIYYSLLGNGTTAPSVSANNALY